MFSSVQTVELHALMNRNCHSTECRSKSNNISRFEQLTCDVRVPDMRGTVKIARKEPGTISRVVLKVQQVFHKLDCDDIEAVDDARFKYFTQKVPFTQVSFFPTRCVYSLRVIDWLVGWAGLPAAEGVGVEARVHFLPILL
jgi:hypothetical protein